MNKSPDSLEMEVLGFIDMHMFVSEEYLKEKISRTFDTDNPSVLVRRFSERGWIVKENVGWTISKSFEKKIAEFSLDASVEDEELGSEEAPKEPYDAAKLKVEQRQISIFQALRKIEKKEINIHPDFQRSFVWDVKRQSRLIESILIKIPLPAFYLDATDDVRWSVVDGLQRLTTLFRYCREESFGLVGLEFLKELNGKKFSELPKKYQVIIEDDTQLIFNNLMPGTPARAKFTIFSRVNTGGVQLSPQEIRHALNQGRITKLLKGLSASNEFLYATDGAVDPMRMADQELILRALSFMAFGVEEYERYQDMDTFLVDCMERFNCEEFDPKRLKRVGKEFLEYAGAIKDIFGKYAFRKFYEKGGRRGPLNKALFESWVVVGSEYDIEYLRAEGKGIVDRFIFEMNENSEFVSAITYGTGNISAVRRRYEVVRSIIEGE